jgi:di/tricarboxylate transporter
VSVHIAGILGLVLIFAIGTLRPINLGVLALAMTFLVGTIAARESPAEMYRGFPVDLFVLLTGVTYLFAIADRNSTLARIVAASVRIAQGRRSLIPWVVVAVAAAPAMAGAIGSAGVALLAPIALRLAERCEIDRRLIGLMVVHGAAAGNFSPLNVLGAIVLQAVTTRGLEMSAWGLFAANIAYNVALGAIAVAIFSRSRRREQVAHSTANPATAAERAAAATHASPPSRMNVEQACTVGAFAAVAIMSLGFGFSIGFTALAAGAVLQLMFLSTSAGAERQIAWPVVLLVCGIVTYVGALQRYGTVEAVGNGIAALGTPMLVALLLCAVGAVTSAFVSSAGILGALIPLAAPLMVQGGVGTTGLVIALALSATVVDATPFSTVGALVVANASEAERQRVYRGLLAWGAVMVVTAPVLTWLLFVVPA